MRLLFESVLDPSSDVRKVGQDDPSLLFGSLLDALGRNLGDIGVVSEHEDLP